MKNSLTTKVSYIRKIENKQDIPTNNYGFRRIQTIAIHYITFKDSKLYSI